MSEEDYMTVANRIRQKLTERFAPERLEIEDESDRHRGHAGAQPGGESHFRIVIVSPAFSGLARVARQRMVYEALADELAGPVHALAVTALAPEQG